MPDQLRIGDLRSFYESHVEFVRCAVLRLGGPRCDAEDLVHDVFMVALRKHHTFEGRAAPSTWLYGIAIKVVASARRRAKLRRLLGAERRAPEEPDTPARIFDRQEAGRLVYGILDKIAERKRTVFILYELEGLSGDEISRVVGCPLKTVWTRLFYARKEFLAHLAKLELRQRREESLTQRRPR